MQFRAVLALGVTAAAALAGCSKPASVPDYHSLIATSANAATAQAAMEHAQEQCSEAGSDAAKIASPWCGVVHKAERCSSDLDWVQPGPGSKTPTVSPASLAKVEEHPTPGCPAN